MEELGVASLFAATTYSNPPGNFKNSAARAKTNQTRQVSASGGTLKHMKSRAALIESGGPMAGDAANSAPRGGAMKFQYASGSKPLDGYTIKRGIGRGGFGEVYFATSDAGKEVALKLIERNLEVELRGVSQCLNLKHPNLIDLYDIRYDEQGDAWVVMEYVAGPSLKDVIDRNPNGMPLDEVAALVPRHRGRGRPICTTTASSIAT